MFLLIWTSVAIVYCSQFKFLHAICGYESCHPTKNGYTNVHIIPHSHDDVGWTKTVEQYYRDPSDYDVRAILRTTYESLLKNPDRRFIYVESAFFFKWWDEQSESVKEKYKTLVNNGQLEFVSGAWSMNDEATTNYQAIIDQFTLGLRTLNATFGNCGRPRVGWQIDPFGHSSEMASILSQIGFDGLFLGRIDYQDKQQRMNSKTLEMIWQASKSLGSRSNIFTSILYNTYFAPEGFSWDMWSGVPELDNYNIQAKWNDFVTYLDKQSPFYNTKNIIITMGGDFNYMYAERYFRNLDRLIQYGNKETAKNQKYHLLYSTPSCYLKAVHDEGIKHSISWPLKTDDFFPYADEKHAYWTGYFTSRPTLKYFERLGNNFLQVCKQLSVLANLKADHNYRLNNLKQAMGILQHHDAVSGTEQEHVSKDYATILSNGIKECDVTSSTALRHMVQKAQSFQPPSIDFHSCLLTNISQCEFTERSNSFVVTIYNPLSKFTDLYIRLPVKNNNYTVRDFHGYTITTQLVPIPDQVLGIPGRKSEATHELVFQIANVLPLGFKSYHVSVGEKSNISRRSFKYLYPQNKKVNLRIGRKHGLLKKIVVDGNKIPIRQEFYYYQGAPYDLYRASGAYIFRPENDIPQKVADTAQYKIYSGDIVHEVHQTFNSWVSQVVRMYKGSSYVELSWLVGPLPEDGVGREVISHFTTHLNTSGLFYTDSNCRETIKRIRNHRPTWNLNVTENIAGNYYPVTSKILIKDSNSKLTVAVLTDRSQGGTSAKDGEIELMVHRNTVYDDRLGVIEPLNEKAFQQPLVVRGTHWIVAGYGDIMAEMERELAEKRLLSAWTFISPTNYSYNEYKKIYNMEYSGITSALPKNVKILTLEPLYETENSILLRLEHIYATDEHTQLSQPVQMKLKNLFKAFDIISIRETNLAGNQWLNDSYQMKLSRQKVASEAPTRKNDYMVKLTPMQIRTFIININRKENN